MARNTILLTEGYSNPHQAKTARNLILYGRDNVLALLDSQNTNKTAGELLEIESNIPVVSSLNDFPQADTLIIGIATPGGVLPQNLLNIVYQAVMRKMNIISGLHEFLTDNEELMELANLKDVTITDIRKNNFHQVSNREGINPNTLRVHTVGNDCSLGKMVVSMQIARKMEELGNDIKFCPTGQTGMLIEGNGLPIDTIVGDYINGAAEYIVKENQHHEILLIEGQGSLVHPRYSGVTLGLLHGCQPQALIMCYEMGRKVIHGVESFEIPPLEEVIKLYETMASVMHPAKVIGIAMNTRKHTLEEANREREMMREKFGLPVCDVVRHGPEELCNAIIDFKKEYYSSSK